MMPSFILKSQSQSSCNHNKIILINVEKKTSIDGFFCPLGFFSEVRESVAAGKKTPFFQFFHYTYPIMMDINYIAVIGLVAGACTTLSFLPQAIKTMRMKQTRDISLSMYIILAAGILLWIIYGILIRDLPVILANSISFAFASIILILKIKHG